MLKEWLPTFAYDDESIDIL